jgi:hypothetical protein
MAKADGDIKAAIAAEVKRGEVRKFYIRQVETGKPGDFSDLNDEELKAAIAEQTKELAELDPEFAEFAKQLVQ